MATAAASDQQDNRRPVQVTRAVVLLWAALSVAIVAGMPLYVEPVPAGVSQWSVWLLLGVVCGFWALMTALIGRRHNWARVVTLVLFVGGLVVSILDYKSLVARPAYSLVIEVLTTIMTGIALYWLFTEPAASWFRKRHRHAL